MNAISDAIKFEPDKIIEKVNDRKLKLYNNIYNS